MKLNLAKVQQLLKNENRVKKPQSKEQQMRKIKIKKLKFDE